MSLSNPARWIQWSCRRVGDARNHATDEIVPVFEVTGVLHSFHGTISLTKGAIWRENDEISPFSVALTMQNDLIRMSRLPVERKIEGNNHA